ncbi:hypothetical protein CWI39_0475p0030 [Hamiltosporidium magnivora]|uniref:Uncharacterized protein n=1 Tax=Hamiltosporidium magnivora TaxID=148818 RepID=A0A4Q9L9Z8_9MICR|nr:putative RNA-binding protein Luc7-like 1 [Hamiltosporidium tvaerminnensis]TBU04276.1 hypothetical protein CWI36_0787p0020 [Hamiltosporidium magnivora]TBU06532.1 hypothetical protein CWI39_0475p0030 [Hamiltosporidium magnivora]
MNSKKCEEYIVADCTKTIFYIEGFTIPCNLFHCIESKRNYQKNKSNKIFPYESSVYQNICKIITDIDRKISMNKKLLRNLNAGTKYKKYENAINECEKIFICEHEKENNYKELHNLLSIHGTLILEMEELKDEPAINLSVCDVCSAICVKREICKHGFHDSYKMLRIKQKELENRLTK